MLTSHNVSRFHWADYMVFVLTILLSSSVGIYYGIKDRKTKQNNVDNYLLGGRNMNIFPVSMSLFVSWLSAISFMGDPVEVYYYGAIYWVIGVGYCLGVPPAAYYFAPKFHDMRMYSCYEYLSKRYNWFLRVLGSVSKGIVMGLYSGIVLYGPALALAQVSGIQVWVSIVGVGLVCTLYTTIGGIKAVFWADTIQAGIMFIGLIVLIVRGCIVAGGLGEIWRVAASTGRINFNNFDPNPFVRSTFWTYLFGGFNRVFNPYISSQMMTQRYLSVRTPKEASIVVYLNLPMYAVFVSMFAVLGLVMVAYFDGCDPLAAGKIEKADQMVPLLMMELLGFLPGFPGLFLASLFCASLSTMSSVQSALSLSPLKDVVEPLYERSRKKSMSDKLSMGLSKLFCLLLGCCFIGLSLILMDMKDGSIFQFTIKITGCLLGPSAGLFFVGMLFDFVDSTSAIAGSLITLCLTIWWSVGWMVTDLGPSTKLPVSTNLCYTQSNISYTPGGAQTGNPWSYAQTTEAFSTTEGSQTFRLSGVTTLYQLSPMVYSTFGFGATALISVSLGAVSTFVCKKRNRRKIELHSKNHLEMHRNEYIT